MNYLTSKQISEKWGITPRRVQDMCKNGAIFGAERHGREWLIPANAEKPLDKRSVKTSDNSNQADSVLFVNLLSRYAIPGCAKTLAASLKNTPDALEIFNMQLYFYQGKFKKSLDIAMKYLDKNGGIQQHILIGTQLSLCAIVSGDLKIWNLSQDYLKNYAPRNKSEKDIFDFLLGASASLLYDASLFPDWFRRGDFTPLPLKFHALARLYYAKYLYIIARDPACIHNNIPQLDFIRVIPLIIEPMLSQSASEENVINEAYLRLMCACFYHVGGEDSLAKKHIKKSTELLLPDKLYLPLAEYRHRLGSLLDDHIEAIDKTAFEKIKQLSKQTNPSWIKLHNLVMNKTVSENLSLRERQIAKLAIYGLSNKEIADRYDISVNAVKQSLRSVMDKTGVNSRTELYKFV